MPGGIDSGEVVFRWPKRSLSPLEPNETIAVCTNVRLIDESPDWLVVDKPAPLIVHPTSAKKEPTLLGELNSLLAARGEQTGTLSLLNRLDRETSGLVLVSRTPRAARVFGKAMERREIGKEYQAIVHGWPDWERCECRGPLLRRGEVEESRIWIKQMVHPDGRPSATSFEVMARRETPRGRFSLVRALPETGRTHQIRVHLSHAGFPIVGDKIYGPSEDCYLEFIERGWSEDLAGVLFLRRQALHATGLMADWEGRRLSWASPLPPEMASFLEIGG